MNGATDPSPDSPPNVAGWRLIGVGVLVVSLALIVAAAVMRPTIETPRPTSGLLPSLETIEVFDAGLLQQQMMLYLGGLFGLVLASIAIATASILNVVWHSRQR